MLKAKEYQMNSEYLDLVVTFPKQEYGPQPIEEEKVKGKQSDYWDNLSPETIKELNKARSLQRTKTKVKRYVIHKNMKYMWTLTFKCKKISVKSKKGVKTYDMGEIEDAWKMWKNFMQRCRRAGIDFPYVVTVEVQEKRLAEYGEKVFHFHFATNVNIPIDKPKAKKRGMKYCMQDLWIYGYSYVTKPKSKRKYANGYLMKYIGKMFDETEKGAHRYRCSEKMECPTKIRIFTSEEEADLYVKYYAARNGLDYFKAYFPLSDGHNEVLYYGIKPFPEEKKSFGRGVLPK